MTFCPCILALAVILWSLMTSIFITTAPPTVKSSNSRLLQVHDLTQIVDFPAHTGGHILNWIVVCSDVTCLSFMNVKEIDVLGDHKATISTTAVKWPSAAKQLLASYNMRAIDSLSFLSDIKALVEGAKWCAELELVNICSNGLHQILDCHTPLMTRCIRVCPLAPWLNNAVRAAEWKQREVECCWRATWLTAHRHRHH